MGHGGDAVFGIAQGGMTTLSDALKHGPESLVKTCENIARLAASIKNLEYQRLSILKNLFRLYVFLHSETTLVRWFILYLSSHGSDCTILITYFIRYIYYYFQIIVIIFKKTGLINVYEWRIKLMEKQRIRAKYRRQYRAIPYSFSSTGKIVLPKEAVPHKTYHCPECKGKLSLRMSRLKNPYFSHTPGKKRICHLNRSSVTLAKHVLRLALEQWINGKGHPVEVQLFFGKPHELPQDQINEMKLDQRIHFHQKRGYHSHITLLDHYGQTLLNIEIRDTNRKRHIKHPSWLEVSAEEILSNPYLLSSLNPHMTTPYFLQPRQLNLF